MTEFTEALSVSGFCQRRTFCVAPQVTVSVAGEDVAGGAGQTGVPPPPPQPPPPQAASPPPAIKSNTGISFIGPPEPDRPDIRLVFPRDRSLPRVVN